MGTRFWRKTLNAIKMITAANIYVFKIKNHSISITSIFGNLVSAILVSSGFASFRLFRNVGCVAVYLSSDLFALPPSKPSSLSSILDKIRNISLERFIVINNASSTRELLPDDDDGLHIPLLATINELVYCLKLFRSFLGSEFCCLARSEICCGFLFLSMVVDIVNSKLQRKCSFGLDTTNYVY